MVYQSTSRVESRSMVGVELVIRKMSLSGRIAMTQRLRDLAERVEFLQAGESAKDKLDSALLASEIDRNYVLWGLQEVVGLDLDGEPATPLALIERGPENLLQEAVEAIKCECGLSEDERKN